MFSKYKLKKIVDLYATQIIRLMGMHKWRIKIHLYSSESKYLRDKGVRPGHNYGMSYLSEQAADIILFYDHLENETAAISTLIHELLHVRFSSISSLITLYVDRANLREEAVILMLEKFIMATIDLKKLRSIK